MNTQQKLKVLNAVRKEVENMDVVMTSVIRTVTKELKLQLVEINSYVTEPNPLFDGSVVTIVNCKFAYIDTHRWIKFTIETREDNQVAIHYYIFSYGGLLRSRRVRVNKAVEVKAFVTLVLKQDLVLETDSSIVE